MNDNLNIRAGFFKRLNLISGEALIYADYNGSAPLCKDVKDYLSKRLEQGPFANPNTIHRLGKKVLMAMENARSICAKNLGADYNQIIFNSGSTEGIATIFYSLLGVCKKHSRKVIIISGIEHSAVKKTAEFYAHNCGYDLKVLPTLTSGIVDIQALQNILEAEADNTAMVSIMAANNETGVIQPYKEIGQLCSKYQVPYFSDTTQLIGKDSFSFKDSMMDFAVMSGHKIGAITGSGLILAKDTTQIHPLIIGGGQEKGYRGGTQNYIGNETLAVALDYFAKNQNKLEQLKQKRIEFEAQLKSTFPKIVILGEDAPRLASTTYISYPGIHGQAVQIELEAQDIYVSTSSACSDNQPVTSAVLKSMGVDDQVGRGVIRISLGPCSDLNAYDQIRDALIKIYGKLEKVKSY